MNIVSYAFSRFVGIDVSKETLDIASAECQSATIGNTRKAINTWITSLLETANTIVVLEATGGYESLLVKLLHQRKIALAVVNPRQVRDFAKGIGKNAKTDAIDAQVIARFGEVVRPAPQVAQSDKPTSWQPIDGVVMAAATEGETSVENDRAITSAVLPAKIGTM